MTTNNATSPALEDIAFLAAFLDTLIPPSEDGKLPAAGALGLAAEVATAVQSRPQLAATVEAALAAIRTPDFATLDLSSRVERIEAQLDAHPDLIPAVTTPLYYAYYQHPTVLIGLGLPPRPPFPEGYEVEATDPGLLELLRSRGSEQPEIAGH